MEFSDGHRFHFCGVETRLQWTAEGMGGEIIGETPIGNH